MTRSTRRRAKLRLAGGEPSADRVEARSTDRHTGKGSMRTVTGGFAWLAIFALRAVGRLIFRLGLAGVVIRLNPDRVRVLAYHAVESGSNDLLRDLECNTPPALFAAQISFITANYNVLSLEGLEGALPRFPLILTFDDGYRSVYSEALPILRANSLPCTVYLVAATLATNSYIWTNELNWLLRRTGISGSAAAARRLGLATDGATSIKGILAHAQNLSPSDIASLLAELRRLAGAQSLPNPSEFYITREDAQEMVAHGVTFGNHTWSHFNLTVLDESAQYVEVTRAREILEKIPGFCDSLAYPFGAWNGAASEVALRTGHRMLACIGGSQRVPLDLQRIARVPVSDQVAADLFAALEIIEPIKGWIRSRSARRYRRAG
jgi:peptidoglycan/xylan/chitin deacetylase (PgdA/CDA1 family)